MPAGRPYQRAAERPPAPAEGATGAADGASAAEPADAGEPSRSSAPPTRREAEPGEPAAPGAAGGRRVPALYRPVLLAAGLVLLALLFRELATLVLAVLVTVILAIPLSATATRLERLHVPRALGAILGLLLGLAVLGGIVTLVVPQFSEQVDQLVAALPAIGDSLSSLAGDITGEGPDELGDNLQEYVRGFVDEPERLVGPLTSVGLTVAGMIAALILVVVTAVMIASRPEPLLEGFVRVVPPTYRDIAVRVIDRLRTAWVGWLRGVLVDMAVTAVLLYAGLTIIGLDFALVFAIVAALLVVIPYFGSVAGAIPPVLFGLSESPTTALLVLGVYIVVQQIESNVLIPLVMARAVKLHPAVVAIGVVIVGQLFGLVGLFVAVPILSTIMILAEELWVRPMEESHDGDRGGREAPEAAVEEATP